VILTADHGEYLASAKGERAITKVKDPLEWLKQRLPGVDRLKKRGMQVMIKALARFGRRDGDFYRAWVGHGFHVYDTLVHVPLIMYGPGLFPAGVEIDGVVSHVDLYPTLVSACALQGVPTWQSNGIDLTPSIVQPALLADRAVYLEASGERWSPTPKQWLVGVRTAQYKYVRGLINEQLPQELYDVQQDPGETNNLIAQMPGVAAMLRGQLERLMQTNMDPASEESGYSPEELDQIHQHLRELGYSD
jgi:arylsulfatase A-like enzyme